MTTTYVRVLSGAFAAAALLAAALAATQVAYANVEDDQDGHHHKSHSGIEISIASHAMVMNHVETKADTGDNSADGSYGGDGGDGGEIENEYGEQDVEGATTGNGGDGGNSGFGGAVQTGDALAETTVDNNVNSATVTVDECACEDATSTKSRVRIHIRDSAFLMNGVRTKADSGDNYADGSYAGSGGDGGDIENGSDEEKNDENADQEVDDATTGNGGIGGNSSDGGSVLTGAATSRTNLVNLVNSRLVRVRG